MKSFLIFWVNWLLEWLKEVYTLYTIKMINMKCCQFGVMGKVQLWTSKFRSAIFKYAYLEVKIFDILCIIYTVDENLTASHYMYGMALLHISAGFVVWEW